MKTTKRKLSLVCAAALALALVPVALHAEESYDNDYPATDQGAANTALLATTYMSNSSAFWGTGADTQISPSGDLDWSIVQCTKKNGVQTKIKNISVSYNPFVGDLDILIQRPDTGAIMTQGIGTTGTESIDLPSLNYNVSTVILRVYGYQGATGFYSVSFSCI
jgi:hypothetical protein